MTEHGSGPRVVSTHAAVWYLQQDPRLSRRAEGEIDRALAGGHPIYVASISVVELVYLSDKGRIPAAVIERVGRVLRDPVSRFRLAPLNLDVAEATRNIAREVIPDLPDRVIAATALALGVPLITRDGKVRASSLETIW